MEKSKRKKTTKKTNKDTEIKTPKSPKFPIKFWKGTLEKRSDNDYVYVVNGEAKRSFTSLEEAKKTFGL